MSPGLVQAAQAGDALAMGVLLERHRARLYAVAASMLGPDAEDAVHDAFLTALQRIGDVRDPDAFGAWLTTILVNTCRARLRRPRHEVSVPEIPLEATLEDAAARLDATAQRDWLWTALARLSEPLRLAVMLRHFSAASSYEEIAAICDVPVGTVRSRLSTARSRSPASRRASARARWRRASTAARPSRCSTAGPASAAATWPVCWRATWRTACAGSRPR